MENAEPSPSARVAANVRRLRHDQGMTLSDLSAALSALGRPMAVTTLSKVELGQRGIDVDDLVALAEALNVSVSTLLGDVDPSEATKQLALELVQQWRAAEARYLQQTERLAEEIADRWDDMVVFAKQDDATFEAVKGYVSALTRGPKPNDIDDAEADEILRNLIESVEAD